MRRRFILAAVSVALGACQPRAIVFQHNDLPEVGDAAPPANACPTIAYTLDAAARAPTGSLELTSFDTGFGLLPLLETGPDGNLWFTTAIAGRTPRWRLDRITPTGSTTQVRAAVFGSADGSSQFSSLAAGPDGYMWGTEIYAAQAMALVTRTAPDGSVNAIALGDVRQFGGMAQGPDGNLWFLEFGTEARMGRITPGFQIDHFALGSGWNASDPRTSALTAGPDGNVWFVAGTSRVGRMTVDGALTEFALPRSDRAESIVAGQDGFLWFRGSSQEPGGSSTVVMGRVTPVGCITLFKFKLANGLPGAGLAADREGNLWFTADDEIVRFAPSGTTAEYVLPGALGGAEPCFSGQPSCLPSSADAITLGPDGQVWFTDSPDSAVTHVVRISEVR